MRFKETILSLVAVALAILATTSCIKEPSVSNKEREQISLKAWIALNKSELLDNFQETGGY